MIEIELEKRKYLVRLHDNGLLQFFRHGHAWDVMNQELRHSNLVRAMVLEIDELRAKVQALEEVQPSSRQPYEPKPAQSIYAGGPYVFVWVKGTRGQPVPEIWDVDLKTANGKDRVPFLFKTVITHDEAAMGPDALAARYPLGVTS